MPHANFVHLRTHTAYSLSEGAIKIKQLVKMCQAEQMPAVGVTDTGNLFGALELSSACAEVGIQPIIGSVNPDRIRQAAKADELELTREEWYRLLLAARGEPLP